MYVYIFNWQINENNIAFVPLGIFKDNWHGF